MSGKPGRSGRRPQKPWPTMVSAMPVQSQEPAWEPAPEDWATLGEPGRRFLQALLDANDFNVIQGALLLQCAATLDALTQWRLEASSDVKAARLCLQHTQCFSNLLASVRAW